MGFLGDGEVASRDAGLRSRFGERGRGVGSPPLSEIARTERLFVTSGSGDLTSKEDAGARTRAGRDDGGGGTGCDLKWIDGAAGETGRTVDVARVLGATGGVAGRTRRRGDEGGDGLAQLLDARGSIGITGSVTGRGT